MIDRRRFLASIAAGAAASLGAFDATSMGRIPLAGRLSFQVPFALDALDPHELRQPAAALFASAAFDALFGVDAANNPFPSLVQAPPAREGDGTIIKLREGLKSARGVALSGGDVVASVERARARAGGALLAEIPRPEVRKGESLVVSFGAVDPGRLARVLASPLLALVPRGFSPTAPDGTGAFKADVAGGKLTLTRNLNAARGASFLDGIDVTSAADLKTSLRDFEAERDDVGWLGMGLHDGRKNAVRFDAGRAGWVVLETGVDAGAFGQPGVAQRLVDAFPAERLAHLGFGSLPAANGDPAWGGQPCDLLVDDGSAFLVEVARAVAPILSRAGHEVTVAAVHRSEIAKRRAAKKATLVVDLVRPMGSGALATLISLATAEDVTRGREIDRHPPKVSAADAVRSHTSTLRIGVIGEVRIAGGIVPDVVLARGNDGWDLGATWRRPKK